MENIEEKEDRRMGEIDRENRREVCFVSKSCSSPSPHLHINLAPWLPLLSEGQLSLFLLV